MARARLSRRVEDNVFHLCNWSTENSFARDRRSRVNLEDASDGAAQRKIKNKKAAPPHDRFLEAFRWMLLARTLEEKLVSLYRGGLITGGVYIGKGQEAVSVVCGLLLQKGDIFAPLIRDQAGRSAFGEPLLDVTRTYLGSRQGPIRGRDGNIHRGHPRKNELAMISHLGAMISVTVGALMAKRFKGDKDFIG